MPGFPSSSASLFVSGSNYDNFGVSFSIVAASGGPTLSTITCMTVGSSPDVILVGASAGYLYRSTDGGASFTAVISDTARNWSYLSNPWRNGSSTVIIATASTGSLFKSVDDGATWTELTAFGSRAWTSCCASADGSVIYGQVNSTVYKSLDGGSTVTTSSFVRSTTQCSNIDCSENGYYLVGAAFTLVSGTNTTRNWDITKFSDYGATRTSSSFTSGSGNNYVLGICMNADGGFYLAQRRTDTGTWTGNCAHATTFDSAITYISISSRTMYGPIFCSSDDKYVLIQYYNGLASFAPYFSNNSGATISRPTATAYTASGRAYMSRAADIIVLNNNTVMQVSRR